VFSIRFQPHSKQFKKNNGFETFFPYHTMFPLIITISWTPSLIYRNAQWCQSGITQIFQGQCMHYKNQQRKKV